MLDDVNNFPNLVKGLEVDDAKRLMQEKLTPLPDKNYVIVFTARSGSSWLTSILSDTKLLGFPEEYINPPFIRDVATAVNAVEQGSFLSGLRRLRKTPNGVFGIEVREIDVTLFGPGHFFGAFGQGTKFFNLWRQNIVAQAVSLYRAVATNRFHSSDDEAAPPDYDGEGIRKWLIHFVEQENANLAMLQQRQVEFVNLCYEQMVRDRMKTLQIFAKHLGVTLPAEEALPGSGRTLSKIGDFWNESAEKRFRNEYAGLVKTMESRRRINPPLLSRSHGMVISPETPLSGSAARAR